VRNPPAGAPPARVLLIEDNANLAFGLRNNLEIEGYAVDHAATGAEGLARAAEHRPDVILLDLMLPGIDGFRVLRALRERGGEPPILILTALGDEASKVRGLRLGADDYVTKPFSVLELLARVEVLLRRGARTFAPEPPPSGYAEVEVDLARREVRRQGQPVPLSPKEFDLLVALLRRRGAVATRVELLREVWQYPASVSSRTLDTHIAELRRKLEADAAAPRHILTVRKTGYRLEP
jgi:DNA-binding response OmpR family regulator